MGIHLSWFLCFICHGFFVTVHSQAYEGNIGIILYAFLSPSLRYSYLEHFNNKMDNVHIGHQFLVTLQIIE